MIDELLNERDAIDTNLISSQSSLANYERLLASLRGEAKSAEEAVSARLLDMQSADDATREAAKWRMEAARAKSRVLAVRAGLMQSIYESLKDRINAASTDLALIGRKIPPLPPALRSGPTAVSGATRQKQFHLAVEVSHIRWDRAALIRREGIISRQRDSAATHGTGTVLANAGFPFRASPQWCHAGLNRKRSLDSPFP